MLTTILPTYYMVLICAKTALLIRKGHNLESPTSITHNCLNQVVHRLTNANAFGCSVANDEDLERRLEAVLSRRAAALAAAQRGNRVDCAGASKGLFCGLLLLVASLICLILFFVLIRHQELKRLSIYLADVSHCALMVLSILAILIGFIR